MFDVSVEKEIGGTKRSERSGPGRGNMAGGNKRQKKNEKYGFGGKKRHGKSGDAVSSSDMSGFSAKGMKARDGAKVGKVSKSRPGKARRKAMSSK